MQTKDFYLRMKLSSIRKTIKENEALNKFLCLGKEHTNLFNVKKVVKSLEQIAQGEQVRMQEEMRKLEEEESKLLGENSNGANADLDGAPSAYEAMMAAQATGGPGGISRHAMGGMQTGGYGQLSQPPQRMYMMNNQLNTIEEEKHETQNSAYFRENGEETD